MQDSILIYHITDPERKKIIRRVCTKEKIRLREVKKEEYGRPLLSLLGTQKMERSQIYGGEDLREEMMVLAMSRDKMEQILDALKKEEITIACKAVITPYNSFWNTIQLYEELQKERATLKKSALKVP